MDKTIKVGQMAAAEIASPQTRSARKWWRQYRIKALERRIAWIRSQPRHADGDAETWLAEIQALEEKLSALR